MVNLPCLMVSRTNFLRPTCSYTECRLSLQTGSCPTERTTASYSSCLYLIFTDLLLTSRKLIFSGRSPLFHWLACWDAVRFTLHLGLRVSYPEPCPISDHSGTRQDSGFLMQSVVFMLPVMSSDSVLRCHPTSSSDRILSPLLVLCRSPSISCRLSQSVTASFSADSLLLSYSRYGVL